MQVPTLVGRPRWSSMYWGQLMRWYWASRSVSVKTSLTSGSRLCMRRCSWVSV